MRRGSLGASNRAEDTTHIRRTKLVCTIGPATAGRVSELVAAGMDVARVNLSHGSRDEHRRAAIAVRAAEEAAGRPIGILVDLAGPKVRLGALAGGEVTLRAGERFTLRPGSRRRGGGSWAAVSDERLGTDVDRGDGILLADGAAELRVIAAEPHAVVTEVVRGGLIRSRSGVAVPAARRTTPPLTRRDLADLPRLRRLGADYVGQSFIRAAADVEALRTRLGPDGPRIVAKIETRPAVDSFDAILERADAVMIARGDLGVEIPYEEVPLVQKQLLRQALDRGVPTIVATQMLESMVASPRPTRAEASDVANAVFDGADAVLLSGETAIGDHPVLAAEAAARIVAVADERGGDLLPRGRAAGPDEGSRDDRRVDAAHDDLAEAAIRLVASEPDVRAVVCDAPSFTTSTALARARLGIPIVALSASVETARALTLVHGVHPRHSPPSAEETGTDGPTGGPLADPVIAPPGALIVVIASPGRDSGRGSVRVVRVPA